MLSIRQKTYLGSMLLWILAGIIYPVWIGRMYSLGGENGSRRNGVFGFRETGNIYTRAPIWHPPRPSGEPLTLPVLWPWQKPYRFQHVELFLAGIFAQWSLGIIVISFIYSLVCWTRKDDKPDPLLTFAWVIALYLGIGMVLLFGLGLLSMGYAPVDDYMVVLFSLGALGTLFYCVYYQFQISSNPNNQKTASLPVPPPE